MNDMTRDETWELLKRINKNTCKIVEPSEQVVPGKSPRTFFVKYVAEWQWDMLELHGMTKYLNKPYLVVFEDGSRLHVEGMDIER